MVDNENIKKCSVCESELIENGECTECGEIMNSEDGDSEHNNSSDIFEDIASDDQKIQKKLYDIIDESSEELSNNLNREYFLNQFRIKLEEEMQEYRDAKNVIGAAKYFKEIDKILRDKCKNFEGLYIKDFEEIFLNEEENISERSKKNILIYDEDFEDSLFNAYVDNLNKYVKIHNLENNNKLLKSKIETLSEKSKSLENELMKASTNEEETHKILERLSTLDKLIYQFIDEKEKNEETLEEIDEEKIREKDISYVDKEFYESYKLELMKLGWDSYEKNGKILPPKEGNIQTTLGSLTSLINNTENPEDAWNIYNQWKKENPDLPSLNFKLVYSGLMDEKRIFDMFDPDAEDWEIKSLGDMIVAYDIADVLNFDEDEFDKKKPKKPIRPKNRKLLYAAIAAGIGFLLPMAYGAGVGIECEDRELQFNPTPSIVRTIPFEGNLSESDIDVTPVNNVTFNYGNMTFNLVEPLSEEYEGIEEFLNSTPNAKYFIDEESGAIFVPKETLDVIGTYDGNETWKMYNPETGEFEDYNIPQEGNITGSVVIGDETIMLGEYVGLRIEDFVEGLSYTLNETRISGKSVDKTPLLTPSFMGLFGGLFGGYTIGDKKHSKELESLANDYKNKLNNFETKKRDEMSKRYAAISLLSEKANRDKLENLSSEIQSYKKND